MLLSDTVTGLFFCLSDMSAIQQRRGPTLPLIHQHRHLRGDCCRLHGPAAPPHLMNTADCHAVVSAVTAVWRIEELTGAAAAAAAAVCEQGGVANICSWLKKKKFGDICVGGKSSFHPQMWGIFQYIQASSLLSCSLSICYIQPSNKNTIFLKSLSDFPPKLPR